jgi:hypothetical protein
MKHATKYGTVIEDGTATPDRMASIESLIRRAVAAYEALPPERKAALDYEQRRSFVRGMCPYSHDFKRWCEEVDKLLPRILFDV